MRQDPQNLARFAYRAPLDLGSPSRPSILMSEGLGDSLVPFYATKSGAAELGIVQLEPPAEDVPFLSKAAGAQTAAEAIRQGVSFFTSAASGVPAIVDPFAP